MIMGWYRQQLKFAEGPGDWEFRYFPGDFTDVEEEEIKRDLNGDNAWNHGYRGCTVERVPDDQVPMEILMAEAEATLAQHQVLQQKLRDLAETIRLSALSTRSP
jgi:hypothetical protein